VSSFDELHSKTREKNKKFVRHSALSGIPREREWYLFKSLFCQKLRISLLVVENRKTGFLVVYVAKILK
jgi:hypothetical protein